MAKKEGVNRSQVIRDYYKANPKATTQEVVGALGKQGVTVSVGLVNTVKSKHNKRQAAKKAAASEAKVMEKKPEVSKAQAVRDYLKSHRGASNKEVSVGLKAQGVTVTPNHVANIKGKSKKRRKAVKTVVASTGVDIAQIKAAFGLLKMCGSLGGAKGALNAAEEIKKLMAD